MPSPDSKQTIIPVQILRISADEQTDTNFNFQKMKRRNELNKPSLIPSFTHRLLTSLLMFETLTRSRPVIRFCVSRPQINSEKS